MRNKVVKFYVAEKLIILLTAAGLDKDKLKDYINVDVLLPKQVNKLLQDFGFEITIDELLQDVDLNNVFEFDKKSESQEVLTIPETVAKKMAENIHASIDKQKTVSTNKSNEEKLAQEFEAKRQRELEEKRREELRLEKERQLAEKKREQERRDAIKARQERDVQIKNKIVSEQKRISGIFTPQDKEVSKEMIHLSEFKEKEEGLLNVIKNKVVPKKVVSKKEHVEVKQVDAPQVVPVEKVVKNDDQAEMLKLENKKSKAEAKEAARLEKEKQREVLRVQKAQEEKVKEEQKLLAIAKKEQEHKEKLALIEAQNANKVLVEQNIQVQEKMAKEVARHAEMARKAVIDSYMDSYKVNLGNLRESKYKFKETVKQYKTARKNNYKLERSNLKASIAMAKKLEQENFEALQVIRNEFLEKREMKADAERLNKLLDVELSKKNKAKKTEERKYEIYLSKEMTSLAYDVRTTKDIVGDEYLLNPTESHSLKIETSIVQPEDRIPNELKINENYVHLKKEDRKLVSKLHSRIPVIENNIYQYNEKQTARKNNEEQIEHSKAVVKRAKQINEARKNADLAQLEKDRQYNEYYRELANKHKYELKMQSRIAEAKQTAYEEQERNNHIVEHNLAKREARNVVKTNKKLDKQNRIEAKKEKHKLQLQEKHFIKRQKQLTRLHVKANKENIVFDIKLLKLQEKNALIEKKNQKLLAVQKHKDAIEEARMAKIAQQKEYELRAQQEVAKLKAELEAQRLADEVNNIKKKVTVKPVKVEVAPVVEPVKEVIKETVKTVPVIKEKTEKELRIEAKAQLKDERKAEKKQKVEANVRLKDEKRKLKYEKLTSKKRELEFKLNNLRQMELTSFDVMSGENSAKEKIKQIEQNSIAEVLVSNNNFTSMSKEDFDLNGRRKTFIPTSKEIKQLRKQMKKERKAKDSIKARIKSLREKDQELKLHIANESARLNENVKFRNEKRLLELDMLKEDEVKLVEQTTKFEKNLKKNIKADFVKQKKFDVEISRKAKELESTGSLLRKEELELQKQTVEKRLESVRSRTERTNLEFELLKTRLATQEQRRVKAVSKDTTAKPKLDSKDFVTENKVYAKAVDQTKARTGNDAFREEIRKKREEQQNRVLELNGNNSRNSKFRTLEREINSTEIAGMAERLTNNIRLSSEMDEYRNEILNHSREEQEKIRNAKVGTIIQKELKYLTKLEKVEIQRIKEKSKYSTKQEVRRDLQNLKQSIRLQKLRLQSSSIRKELSEKLKYADFE